MRLAKAHEDVVAYHQSAYDAYEVALVHEYCDAHGELYSERCEEECDHGEEGDDVLVRSYWTLFGHRAGWGAETIGDFDDEAVVFNVLSSILGRPVKHGTGETFAREEV